MALRDDTFYASFQIGPAKLKIRRGDSVEPCLTPNGPDGLTQTGVRLFQSAAMAKDYDARFIFFQIISLPFFFESK